ncbi:MAG: hypothetical protein A3J29_04200, partial [Acidobacteria bacterium RIFCSPLOWO2_12_FULL_67_14b]
MRIRSLVLPLAVLMLALIALPASAQRREPGTRERAKLDPSLTLLAESVTGESGVIIEFNDERDAARLIKNHGGKAGRRLGILNARVGRLPNSFIKRLSNHPAVKRISLDRDVEGAVARTAVTIGARAVQELMGYSGAGIGVAIVDSGVTGWHDDLTAANGQGQRVSHFMDFVNGRTESYDDWGHGTHVAGIVGGNGADTLGVRRSVAPDANIIALKALDNQGHGTISSIIAAIDYAVANKDALNIRVINLSLGAGVFESYETDPLTLAAKRAVDAGIVVVAAAGNLGRNATAESQYGGITSPGNAPWVLTVGASSTEGTTRRSDDTIAGFSSRGPTAIDYLAKPDLVAPGTGIVSTSDPNSLLYLTKPQALLSGSVPTAYLPYLSLSGTSMAAPVVAGSVALMLEANPSLTPNLVKAILQYTSQARPQYDFLTQGAGFLNTRGAVKLARFFAHPTPGKGYPVSRNWSRHIIWGNQRIGGGAILPSANAWDDNIVWGSAFTDLGDNIVWGSDCDDYYCDNIVWGSNLGDDNIVWGSDCDDYYCDNI